MTTKCLVCIQLTHPIIYRLVKRTSPPGAHLTILPPFTVEETSDIRELPYEHVKGVTDTVRSVAQTLRPFEISFNRVREHPNATETARVISLPVEPSTQLEAIRRQCVTAWPEKVNLDHLFPFHLTVATDLSEAEASVSFAAVEAEFQPFSARVFAIDVFRKNDQGQWQSVSSNLLARTTTPAE